MPYIITTPDEFWHKQTSGVSQNTCTHRTTSWFFSSVPASQSSAPFALWLDERVLSRLCSATAASRSDATGDGRGRFALWINALSVLHERGVRIHRDGLLASTVASKESGSFTGTYGKDLEYLLRLTESSPLGGNGAPLLHCARVEGANKSLNSTRSLCSGRSGRNVAH